MDNNTDKKTALYEEHVKLGAKIVPFGGWSMPVQYKLPDGSGGIIDEHKTVREHVGLFDVSHMGEFFISGPDAVKFLNYVLPQDISKLQDGKVQYCQFLNEDGGIIDDLMAYALGNGTYLLIVNASKTDEDYAWLSNYVQNFDVVFENKSQEYSLLALQGPKAVDVLKKFGVDCGQKFLTIKKERLEGIDVYLSRSGYTGEDGFEILVENAQAPLLWNKILEYGREFGIKPIGLGARDTLRLEAGLLLNGSDMDDKTTPYEASIGWSIPKDKEDNYIGKENVKRKDKKLIALEMTDNAIARHGYDVCENGEIIGTVTSGSPAPSLGKNIALAYVTKLSIEVGTNVEIMIRNKLYNAKVVKKPFIEKKYNT